MKAKTACEENVYVPCEDFRWQQAKSVSGNYDMDYVTSLLSSYIAILSQNVIIGAMAPLLPERLGMLVIPVKS